MSDDGKVVVLHSRTQAQAASAALETARDAYLEALRGWLIAARPARDDAEAEAEAVASVARQMAARYTRHGT